MPTNGWLCWAGKGDLIGLSAALNGEFSLAQGTNEASVPMEMDPVARLPLLGDSEFESRPTYAKVVAGSQAIDQRTAPSCGSAGIEGSLGGELFPLRGH